MSAQRLPSLKLLMGFEAAARHGNFSRAAKELFVSQSAISHQVQQLEEQIGQALFRRVGRGVELTIAGEVLQRSVQRSMETLRSGLGRIATYLDPGLVALVCPAPALHGWLQPRLQALQTALPELSPVLSCDATVRFVDQIDVDILISAVPLGQPGLLEHAFLHDEWIAVCSPGLAAILAPLPVEDYPLHARLLCLEEDMNSEAGASLLYSHFALFRKRIVYDDARLMLDAACRGQGIAYLSRLLAADSIAEGRLVVLERYPVLPKATLWISRVQGQARSPLIEQVFDWLLEQGRRSHPIP